MTLVRYEPWSILNRMQALLDPYAKDGVSGDDSSDVATSQWRPAVDIKEYDERFVIYADLPGVKPEDIDITMEQGVLTLQGERTAEQAEEGDGLRRVERMRGGFYRRFSLPDTADSDRIEAHGENGVLEITLPKHEKEQARKITVKS